MWDERHSGAQDAARNPGVSPFDLTFNHENGTVSGRYRIVFRSL